MKEFMVYIAKGLLKNITYTAKSGMAKGMKLRGGIEFLPELKKKAKKEEIFLKGLDLSGYTVYDIGGYVGVHTLFYSTAVEPNGRVMTFEPSPKNFEKIITNIKLNELKNIDVFQIAIGSKTDKVILSFEYSFPGAGTIQKEIKQQKLSKSSSRSIEVKIDSLDNQIAMNSLPKPNFIKIDVEGLEIDVLIGARKTIQSCKPKLFVEIHGIDTRQKIDNIKSIIEFLKTFNYSIYHIENECIITDSNHSIAKEGHIFCS